VWMPIWFVHPSKEDDAKEAWKKLKDNKGLALERGEFKLLCTDIKTKDEFFEEVDKQTRESNEQWCWCFDDTNHHWYRFVVLTERNNKKLEIPLYGGESEELETFAYDKVDIYRGAQPNKVNAKVERKPFKIEPSGAPPIHFIRSQENWVGSVGIPAKAETPGLVIHIQPKFDQPSIWDMIAERFQRVRVFSSSKNPPLKGKERDTNSDMRVALLGEQFVETLKRVKSNGIGKLHRKTRRRCHDLRGRLDFSRLSYRHTRGFPVITSMRSADISINRMFKCALERLLRCVKGALAKSVACQGMLKALLRDLEMLKCTLFQEVRSVKDFTETLEHTARMQLRLLSEMHTSDYDAAFELAKCVLHHTNPSSRFGGICSRPWLVNMSTLFEDFIHQLVKTKLEKQSSSEPGYIVTRGSKQTRFNLKNDFQVNCSDKVLFIGECKWKATLLTEDYFQVHTYVTEFGASFGALIYPMPIEGMETNKRGIVDIEVISFYDEGETFEKNVTLFIEKLKKLLNRDE